MMETQQDQQSDPSSRRESKCEGDFLDPNNAPYRMNSDTSGSGTLSVPSRTSATKTNTSSMAPPAGDEDKKAAPPIPENGADISPAPPRRLPHLHKLEKKHSSGDLHSRLKTRKLLGVGETDDGDVHRSKLSQILGHSDQLYIRLPQGLRVWQYLLTFMFSVIALWALLFPAHMFDVSFETQEGKYLTLPIRLYGAALLSLSLLHWNSLQCQDRDIIRGSLLSSVIYFSLQTIVTGFHLIWNGTLSRNAAILLGCRAMFALISYVFYHFVGCKNVSIRRTNSTSRDLHKEKEQ